MPEPAAGSARPHLTAILGPARSGKTAEAIARLLHADGPRTIVTPSSAASERMSRRLADLGSPDGVRVETQLELLRRIAGKPASDRVVTRAVAREVIARLAAATMRPDGFFGRVLGAPGFAGALADLVSELKRSCVTPQSLRSASASAEGIDDPLFAGKVDAIAGVFEAYEDVLRTRGLCDEDDLPELAAGALETGGAPACGAIAVLGFHRLSPAFRDVLGCAARAGGGVTVAFPHDPDRPLLFATTLRTLSSLRSVFEVHEVPMAPPAGAAGGSQLAALERRLWAPGAGFDPPPVDGSVCLFDAPNPYAEAEMVARELRREHDAAGTPWAECAILARASAKAAPALAAACEKLGVPLDSRVRGRLADEPVVRRLLALVDMVDRDWQRDDVVAFVKTGAGPSLRIGADWLFRRAVRAAVRAGRAAWENLISPDGGAGGAACRVLQQALAWDAVLRASGRDAQGWCDALEPVLAALLPAREDGRRHPLDAAIRGVLADYRHAAALTGQGPVDLAAFRRDLASMLAQAPVPSFGKQEGVALLDANESRDCDITFAAAIGLIEAGFPRRVNEDPFFRDDEREALARAGLELEPRRDRTDEERLLFYMNVTAPTRRLVLSYPRAGADSDALRSFYLDEVESALGEVDVTMRRLDDAAPRPEDCVDARDRLLAACVPLAEVSPAGADATDAGLRAAAAARGIDLDAAGCAAAAQVLQSRTIPRVPRLEDPVAAAAYAGARAYRVTEIETYRQCPFRHLAEAGLRIRDEDRGPSRADAGSLYHRVLRQYIRDRYGKPCEPVEDMRAGLRTELTRALSDTPIDMAGYRRRLLEHELTGAVESFASREATFRAVIAMNPAHCELAFGPRGPGDPVDGDEPRAEDPGSLADPLTLDAADGRSIELCGTIDRLDLDASGSRGVVLDYKLGSPPEYGHIEAGRSIQLPLYTVAAERVFGKTVVAAMYDSPAEAGRPRFFRRALVPGPALAPTPGEPGNRVRPLSESQYADIVAAAVGAVQAAVTGIRAAHVAPVPGAHCAECPFGDLCRTTVGLLHDGEPLDASGGAGPQAAGPGSPAPGP